MSKARKTAASSGEPDFWRVARDWLHHWLPKVRGSSPKTVEAYRIGLESYVRWLETTEGTQRSHIGFGHFDRARLGRWVEWMRTERGYSDRTIMLRMTTMRVFLDHAGLEHPALTALGNDAAGIRVKPPARKPVDHLGEEHTKALLTAWGTGDAKSRRNRMLLILMYDTAARIGELAALTIADVGMCLCSISCCGFSHDDFSGLGRACRPRNGLNWMVLVSPPERTGKDYDQHAPSTVYPSFAAERGIRRVDRAENTCQRADGA